MASFRIMGFDSVEYHRSTVLGRGDDHEGAALAYYGSRGETPLQWGGKVAERLGLAGAVDEHTYDAIYGPGGVIDPVLGVRLADTRRPGVELVVSATKSVAVLGVLGARHVEDMHAILDAESDATLAFLETWFERQGNRRGQSQTRTATGGLLWARTRHATSRAGDPQPHDHVLIANVTEMLDALGGWKALDTASVRDVNHAATMAGRLAGAHEAVRRGYDIEPDRGPSGKLDHWRLAGIPREVCEQLSKRSTEIDLELESSGFSSHRARGIAARNSRDDKTGETPEDLLPRWRDELEAIGWPVERLEAHLHAVNAHAVVPEPMTSAELRGIAAEVLGPDGELSRYKAFTRNDIVRRVAHRLYGQDPRVLDQAVLAVLNHHDLVPLVGAPAARSRAYVAASVLAAEHAVADTADRLAQRAGPAVSPDGLTTALTAKEHELGRSLTDSQRAAVTAVASEGRGLDLVIGVAGAGKTTALDVLRRAYEHDGYRVIGTATSGQAARALRDEADVDSRTIASLLHRLRAGRETLDHRTVLLVDEAGMTDDRDLLAVLLAAEVAGTKTVVIGDHLQLGAVDPGGGLEALADRHPDAVHVLAENVRQRYPGERDALDQVRAGSIADAVDWYATHDRVRVASTRLDAVVAAVGQWSSDEATGRSTLLLAWRRNDVATLNRVARLTWRAMGRLDDYEITAPGGRRYAAGDRVIALRPLHDDLRTSQRATVTAVDERGATVQTDAGTTVNLTLDQIDSASLDHAYAVTVHRAQGATVDRVQVLADGGGRELAYVAMSRARDTTHIHVVADDLDTALGDLRAEWSHQRRERWTLDSDRPAASSAEQRPVVARRLDDQIRRAQLRLEQHALAQVIDLPRAQLHAHAAVASLRGQLDDLDHGTGDHADTEIGDAHRRVRDAERRLYQAKDVLRAPRLGWRSARQWRKTADTARVELAEATEDLDRLIRPIEQELLAELDRAEGTLTALDRLPAPERDAAREVGLARYAALERAVGAERSFGIEL